MIYHCKNPEYNFCRVNRTVMALNNDNIYECPACGWTFDPDAMLTQQERNQRQIDEESDEEDYGWGHFTEAPKGFK